MNCVASFVVVHRRNRWRHLAIAGDAVFVEGRVTSCKRVNYPAGYRGENSIKVIAHLFLLLLLNQPLTWSPNFFLGSNFSKVVTWSTALTPAVKLFQLYANEEADE